MAHVVALFSARSYDKTYFEEVLHQMGKQDKLRFVYIPEKLSKKSLQIAKEAGATAVSFFVNDVVDAEALKGLADAGIKMIANRCAGYDRLDRKVQRELQISAACAGGYSPFGIAEHAWSLLLALARKLRQALSRTREGNFSLEGLIGTNIHGKTVGVVGTGKIGQAFINIALGFGCKVLAYDVYKYPQYENHPDVKYVEMNELLAESDFVSLHPILLPSNYHMLNDEAFKLMKPTALLVNVSRGALIDADALNRALENKEIAGAAIDVYEGEADYFYEDHSDEVIKDVTLSRFLSMPNTLMTGHAAFLTGEAVKTIARTTINNLLEYFEEGKRMDELSGAIPKI